MATIKQILALSKEKGWTLTLNDVVNPSQLTFTGLNEVILDDSPLFPFQREFGVRYVGNYFVRPIAHEPRFGTILFPLNNGEYLKATYVSSLVNP